MTATNPVQTVVIDGVTYRAPTVGEYLQVAGSQTNSLLIQLSSVCNAVERAKAALDAGNVELAKVQIQNAHAEIPCIPAIWDGPSGPLRVALGDAADGEQITGA